MNLGMNSFSRKTRMILRIRLQRFREMEMDLIKEREKLSQFPLVPDRGPHAPQGNVAIIYKSELDYISRCILDYPNFETGDHLFGYWTENGTPVVLFAIGLGVNANHQKTFFNQDVQYLMTVECF